MSVLHPALRATFSQREKGIRGHRDAIPTLIAGKQRAAYLTTGDKPTAVQNLFKTTFIRSCRAGIMPTLSRAQAHHRFPLETVEARC